MIWVLRRIYQNNKLLGFHFSRLVPNVGIDAEKIHEFSCLPYVWLIGYLLTKQLTAIEALHEAEFTHGDMHLNNVIFGLEDDPKDGENRMEYATYKSDFFLIGGYF